MAALVAACGLGGASFGTVHARPWTIAQAEPQAPAGDPAIAAYEKAMKDYIAARKSFEQTAGAYWQTVAQKRKERFAKRGRNESITLDDYMLQQPPVYSGPPRPVPPPSIKPKEEVPVVRYVPVIADFLKNAESEFGFAPDRPANELAFKRSYAKAAGKAGLTKDQIVRIYAFETGGNAGYDLQAGFESKKPTAHAVSTALGYNQLLHVNTVEVLAEKGDKILAALQAQARTKTGAKKQAFQKKIAIVERMIAFTLSVPDEWGEHVKLANTPKGWGVHALNLDVDVGPQLQVENLATSVAFARRKGFERPLTAAELEMMNLTGDGNGFDMAVMPDAYRDKVPTSNFFNRDGYEANPVVIRNNTVAKLMTETNAVMDKNSRLPGAKQLAAAF